MIPNLQKPPRGSQQRVKRRKKRAESKVAADVRELCIRRDGYCRYALDVWGITPGHQMFVCLPECKGAAEWAHLNEFARYKTRGKPPEERHHTRGTAMLCNFHHQGMMHAGKLRLTFLSELGADGPIAWERR